MHPCKQSFDFLLLCWDIFSCDIMSQLQDLQFCFFSPHLYDFFSDFYSKDVPSWYFYFGEFWLSKMYAKCFFFLITCISKEVFPIEWSVLICLHALDGKCFVITLVILGFYTLHPNPFHLIVCYLLYKFQSSFSIH